MPDKLSIKPHIFFLIAGIVLGIIYTKITPALQVNDEFDHFHRSFRISEGDFLPTKINNRLGGEIPYSIREFELPYRIAATTLEYNIPKGTTRSSFQIPYTYGKTEFVDFPNSSYYSPVSYLPHSLGLFILKKTNCSVGTLYYGTRAFVFLVWLLCMFIFIKQVPFYKWFFVIICLMPMHVYLANSFSADTMSNILAFLFFGAVLKYAFDEKELTIKRISWLLFLGVLLALAKLVYVGIVLSVLIIPVQKSGNRKKFFSLTAMVVGISFITAWCWSTVVMNYYTPYADYNPDFRNSVALTPYSDYHKQKEYIFSHGFYFFKVLYHTLFDHPYTYLNSYVGNFGNYDIALPRWVIVFTWAIVLLVLLLEQASKKLSSIQKIVLAGTAFFSFSLLTLSQHLTWDGVGEGVVDFLHGRYLIPFLPLALLVLTGFFPRAKIRVVFIAVIGLIVIHWASAHRINSRYHKEWFSSETKFTCDAEKVKNKLLVTSDSSILVAGVDGKTDSVSRTGRSSIMLSPASPFGFTCAIPDLEYGDRVEISAWQKGVGAQFVIVGKGKDCKEIYAPSVPRIYGDSTKWTNVRMVFVMGQKCDSLQAAFYLFNPANSKVYIDDLEFSHKKFNRDYLGDFNKRLSLFD